MTQAAARSSQPTAERDATMPLAPRLRSIQTRECIIRHVLCRAHTWKHLIRHVHAGGARQLPVNPRVYAGKFRENTAHSSNTAFRGAGARGALVDDHFRRWHHPGRCPGGDQQPPRPPDHFIASAAWRPKRPLCLFRAGEFPGNLLSSTIIWAWSVGPTAVPL